MFEKYNPCFSLLYYIYYITKTFGLIWVFVSHNYLPQRDTSVSYVLTQVSLYRDANSNLATVVSVLSSSKVGGKAGWNDKEVFIETNLEPASKPEWPHWVFSNSGKVMPNALPSALPEIF